MDTLSKCKNNVGDRIREIRKTNHLSQAEFIERIGISVNYLSELENNKKTMSLDILKRICNEFNVSSDYLLFGEPNSLNKELFQLVVERGNECSVEQIDIILSYFKELKKMKKEIEK